jgi:hypothetical protein
LKTEIAGLGKKAEPAEVNLEQEYYTLIDELQLKLEATEQKFELLLQANEGKWEEFKSELEHSWDSLRYNQGHYHPLIEMPRDGAVARFREPVLRVRLTQCPFLNGKLICVGICWLLPAYS